MNFEAPAADFTKDVGFGGSHYNNGTPQSAGLKYNKRPDCSPLLRNNSGMNYQKDSAPNVQNRNIPATNQHYNTSVYRRLGQRNRNASGNAQNPVSGNNRKRMSDDNSGPSMPKRKWNNRRPPYYQQNATNNYQQNSSNNYQHHSIQNRLDRIRNNHQEDVPMVIKNELNDTNSSNLNDSQDLDVTDITVQVVNHNAQAKEDTLARFKMVLDAKTQNAIKLIQQKRKDKQVIFPFPVTPNITGISLHERFTVL